MYKDFNSKFNILCEEETSRYTTGGGLLPGDYITITKNVFNHPKLKDRPSQFFDRIKEIMGSDLPLKVSAIKTMRPETSNGLFGGAEGPTDYWVDTVQCATPALFVNVMTLPIEVLEFQAPEGNNFSPEIPDQWKRKDNSIIKPQEVNVQDSEVEKQTLGKNPERNTVRTHVNNSLGKSAKDGRSQVAKPKKYKESLSLDDAYSQILNEKKWNFEKEEGEDNDDSFELKQTGDNEPKCPKCGNENAMLNSHKDGGKKCRDCNHVVKDAKKESVELNEEVKQSERTTWLASDKDNGWGWCRKCNKWGKGKSGKEIQGAGGWADLNCTKCGSSLSANGPKKESVDPVGDDDAILEGLYKMGLKGSNILTESSDILDNLTKAEGKTIKEIGYDITEDVSMVQMFVVFTDGSVLRVEPFTHDKHGPSLDAEFISKQGKER